LKDDICISPLGITHKREIKNKNEIVTNDFDKSNLEYCEVVGKGSAGLVYRGRLIRENCEVAIKCINIYEKNGRKQLLNDIKSLIKIEDKGNGRECPFLVNFYGAYLEESKQESNLQIASEWSSSTWIEEV